MIALPHARLASQTWRAHAACAGTDPDLFYPVRPGGRGGGPARVAHEHAISICRRCPVAYQCLWYALDDLPGWLNELEQEVDNAYAELGFLFVRRRGTSDRGRDYVIMSAHQATAMLARLEGWDL